MMTLSKEDGKLFYQLWLPLMEFVNQKYHVSDVLGNIPTAKYLDPAEMRKVADKLWSDGKIIDAYLEGNTDLLEEHREIIRSWKRCVQDEFVMERHLKKGTIFISMHTNDVYQVSGIISTWDEMFYGAPLPLAVKAAFIPFKDVIISDGLVMTYYSVVLGSGIKRMLKDIYMNAKNTGRIIRTL